VFSGIVVA